MDMLGFMFILIGLVFVALIFLVLRVAPRIQPTVKPLPPPVPLNIPPSNDGVLLVQTGGRVPYANKLARKWFSETSDDDLNLERLARHVRPSEAFWELCATEGQSRFLLDGQLVDGTSYRLPYNGNGASAGESAILVSLRRSRTNESANEKGQVSNEAVAIFAELSQAMASSLDVEATIQAVLGCLERLIPSDFFEVTLWDADSQRLYPYRFVGIKGVDRRLERAEETYAPDQGYSGYLVSRRTSLLIANVDGYRDVRPIGNRNQYPFNSYMGIPMIVAGELIGTLEMASLAQNAFREEDLGLLQILSGQAAVALHNAMLFRGEQDRVRELSGLARIAHAIGISHSTHDLFARLVESVAPILEVKSLGFLIYNDNRRSLEAQVPFIGIPAQTIDLCRVPILPETPAEKAWLSQEAIVSANAVEDPRLKTLGLDSVAVAAGIVYTALIPLTSGGRSLGYLQVGDKIDGAPFNDDDLRLLEIIAGQAATIIENASLIQQTQERAQRAESLRRIASLTGSVATLDEILQFSLRDLAQLLRADLAVVLLLDEGLGEIRLHRKSVFGVSPESPDLPNRVALDETEFRRTITGSQHPYFQGNAVGDEHLPQFYRSLADNLHYNSLMIVPLSIRNRGIGELILGSRTIDFFHRSDLTLLSTTASQLTVAIEKSRLYGQTDESLRRRVEQLTAVTHISRELNSTLDLSSLLQLVYDELLRTTQAYCGSILLFDVNPGVMTQRVMLHIGDERDLTLSPLEKFVLQRETPIIIGDFQKTVQDMGDVLVEPPHSNVRSALVAPIAYQGYVAGLIYLHGHSVDVFDATTLEVAQTMAIQAAIALGNAQRFHEQNHRNELLNRRVETLAKLLETSQTLHVEQPLDQSLEIIAYGIQESTPFNIVLISVYDQNANNLVRKTGVGLPIETMNEWKAHTQSWQMVEPFLLPEFRISRSFFIPRDRHPMRSTDLNLALGAQTRLDPSLNGNAWYPDDALLVPLYDGKNQILGLISLDNPRNGLRPDRPTIESLEIFASQAAFVIESTYKLHDLNAQLGSTRMEMQRMEEASLHAQNQLPVLLHKDIEQTIAIQRLNQRVRRIRGGMDIAEVVNRQPNRPNILLALGQEFLTRLEMDAVLVAEPSAGVLRLLHSLGNIPSNVTPEALLGQRNPLRQSLQTGEPILAANIDNTDWKTAPLLQSLEAKSFLCLPVRIEEKVDALLLAISHSVMPAATPEDEQLYHLIMRQASIALQNLRLMTETNRRLQEVDLLLSFSRQLGNLKPESILHTLVESAIQVVPAAQAAMVALWNPEEQRLIPQTASGYMNNQRIVEITYRAGEALPGQAFEQGTPLRIDEVNFARQYSLSSEFLLKYRDATAGLLPISCMLMPIQTMENKLGVLVIDNFKEPAAFSEDDQVLVASLTHQTALALENARLFQASEQRAAQLQALANVAATITSSLQSDELIASLLDQAKSILPYDTGTLWLRQGDQMTIRAARGFEDSEERVGLSAAIEDSSLLKEMITTSRSISVGDVREDERFPSLIEPRYFSWLGVPLLSKGQVIGVIALEKAEADFYTAEHVQSAMTFAGQSAVAFENARLFEESMRRTLELDQRSQRLGLLNRLSAELSGSLDLTQILSSALNELVQAIGCTGGAALLFDDTGRAFINAEFPQTTAQLPMPVDGGPLFERLKESRGLFSTEDVNQEKELAVLQSFWSARQARALIILPLATGADVHGLLLAYNKTVYRFISEEVELARTISNQAAVAIQNARLFDETQRLFAETRQHSAELALLFEMGVSISQVLDQKKLMEATFENVIRLTDADAVVTALLNDDGQFTLDGIDRGERLGPIPWQRTGDSFSELVLAKGEVVLIDDTRPKDHVLPAPGVAIGQPVRSWLGAPLVVRGTPIGVISVQSYQPSVFGDSHRRLLMQVANQLAIALDNARLLSATKNYAADLEKRVSERTDQLAREHRRTQTLLGIIAELSTSLDIDLVLSRTLRVINDTLGSEHSLIMLVNPDDATLQLRASLGYTAPVPRGGQVSTLKMNEGLAGWIITNRQPALIPDLWEDWRWVRRDDQTDLHRSAIAVPLVIGEENMGAMLLFHRQLNFFTPDQLELIQATAKQIAVALNNAQLFRLIRDQAERLGDMLRTQHVETSRSQAILEAVVDGVLVTDTMGKITLFNDSAERLLGMKRQHVLGQSLEHFLGLFGKAGKAWVETIRTWSEDPTIYKPGDMYSEQIELDNRRVVAVNLSPVRLRSDFLGTVSIFRDITHLIEVDRLKSEFVATVSHELRTPMTSIKGYVEIMLMGATGQLSDQQTHFLKIVKGNTERLAILVNDLLDVSRIEAGRVTLSLQPLDIPEVVNKAISDLKYRMKEEGRPMQVEAHLPQEMSSAFGDQERVRQIIDNLLENAYQYTPAEEGKITLSVQELDGKIQIDVYDNGIGIAPEDQGRIFERFYRGEDPLVLATSGTGLGLSIVKRLVEMHNGSIWFKSSGVRGEGSVFSFTLPVFHPDENMEQVDERRSYPV